MNTLLYYEICFFISVILAIAYAAIWHKGMDVSMTCLFVLLPIVCLGCVWMFWAPTPEVAILSNKLVYLAGCFWPLLSAKAVLSQCHVTMRRPVSVSLYMLGFVFFGFALCSDRPGPLYKSLRAVNVGGRYELYPEYGWMHTVIYAVMCIYIIVGITALVYAMKNKLRASLTNLRMMLLGEIVTVIGFFIYGIQKLAGSPAFLYVATMAVFLVASYRSDYYNIDLCIMDTVLREEKLGYISFDSSGRLLCCNPAAEKLFPELRTVRTDRELDSPDGIKKVLADCLVQLEKGEPSAVRILPCKDRMIRLTADICRMKAGKMIYRFVLEDDTDHQKLITVLNLEKNNALHEKEHVQTTLSRYIDPNVAEKLLKENEKELSEGQMQLVTVLFADIRGFTAFSESKSPKDVLQMLNGIIGSITACVKKNGGTVDKIIGDCVMAIWSDLENGENSALAACRAALDMQSAMNALEDSCFRRYGEHLKLGIGINEGPAIVGSVGSGNRCDYTAIGDAVNVASRLESIACGGEIVITAETAKLLCGRGVFSGEPRSVMLKGKSREIPVLSLTDLK